MKMSEVKQRVALFVNALGENAGQESAQHIVRSIATEKDIRSYSSASLNRVLQSDEDHQSSHLVLSSRANVSPLDRDAANTISDPPEEARGTPYPPDFHDRLLDDFFPDLQKTIRSRMHDNPVAKLALGSICAAVLDSSKPHSAFFECGSTVALAVLAMRKTWPSMTVFDHEVALYTNSALVQMALYGLREALPRLLYGDKWLNTGKYLGYFPIRPATIKQIETSNRARDEVQKAWEQMCQDGARFDVSFLTASRFHFVAGPFVGSPDNSFLKYAFYSSARNLVVLIDGSKILLNAGLLREWLNCYNPFLKYLSDRYVGDLVGALFPEATHLEREELMQAVTDAAARNPQSHIAFPSVFVPRLSLQPADEDSGAGDTMEQIQAVESWLQCVEQVMSRRGGGQVTLCISQPDMFSDEILNFARSQHGLVNHGGSGEDTSAVFTQYLHRSVIEANSFLVKRKSPLRLGQPERTEVFVHPGTRQLCETGRTKGCVKVPVWRCTYGFRPAIQARRSPPMHAPIQQG
jgi:hypothetical protein